MADKIPRQTHAERYDPIKLYSNLIGSRFGILTVKEILNYRNDKGRALCKVVCDCLDGNHRERIVSVKDIKSGKLKSCGMCGYKQRVISSDLTGKSFGYLKALYPTDKRNSAESVMWHCICTYPGCNRELDVSSVSLKSGHSKSCGMCQYKINKIKETTQIWKTPIERHLSTCIFDDMLNRCYRTSCGAYKNYGGRGIYICDEWRNNRRAFVDWALSAGYSIGLSIERIDVNGPYAPWNCTFITRAEQALNTTRSRIIKIGTTEGTVSEWANFINVAPNVLYGVGRDGDDDAIYQKIISIARSKGIRIV